MSMWDVPWETICRSSAAWGLTCWGNSGGGRGLSSQNRRSMIETKTIITSSAKKFSTVKCWVLSEIQWLKFFLSAYRVSIKSKPLQLLFICQYSACTSFAWNCTHLLNDKYHKSFVEIFTKTTKLCCFNQLPISQHSKRYAKLTASKLLWIRSDGMRRPKPSSFEPLVCHFGGTIMPCWKVSATAAEA